MLTHQGTKTLRTNRLTLRRFTVEDANLMFENWANDTRVTRYLTWPAHTSPVFTKQLLESWCAEYEKPDFYNWAICLDNHPIGNISAVEISERDESAALGYCIGTAYWRKGIMPEAVWAVCAYLFKEIGVNRIEISHAVKNPASGRWCASFCRKKATTHAFWTLRRTAGWLSTQPRAKRLSPPAKWFIFGENSFQLRHGKSRAVFLLGTNGHFYAFSAVAKSHSLLNKL